MHIIYMYNNNFLKVKDLKESWVGYTWERGEKEGREKMM